MKKVTYVISNIHKSQNFEWTAASRIRTEFDLSFVLLNPGPSRMEEYLQGLGVQVRRIHYRGKKDLPRATWALVRHFRQTRPEIVHTHLVDASLAGIVAAWIAGVRRRIHTRLHADLHHAHYRHGVLYDRVVNRLSTDIVALSRNVMKVLTEMDGAPASKIRVIHYGFDLELFDHVTPERVEVLRVKYRLGKRRPVIGVISRYMEYKGIQYVIPAFERLLRARPDALLFLANTSGQEYAQVIRGMLARLPEGSYREVPFEEDFVALYRLFDVFVHVPIYEVSEAFGQVYTEALASGIPSVFTLSGAASEFVEDGKNALVVGYRDPEAIHAAIERLLGDAKLGARLAAQGRQDVARLFPLERMIDQLSELYREEAEG